MDVVQPFSVNGIIFMDSPSKRDDYRRLLDAYNQKMGEDIYVLDGTTTLNDYVWDLVFQEKEFQKTPDYMKEVCRNATAGVYAEKQETEESDDDE